MKQRYPLLHKISEILLAAADRIADLARKAEDIPGKTLNFSYSFSMRHLFDMRIERSFAKEKKIAYSAVEAAGIDG